MNGKTSLYISSVILIIMLVLLGLVVFWMTFPYKTIEFKQPFEVLNENKQVERGGVLRYAVEYDKFTDLPAEVTKQLVCEDGNRVTLASSVSDAPAGKGRGIAERVIPEKTSLGVCKYQSTLYYDINHFRTIQVELESEPFEVIE